MEHAATNPSKFIQHGGPFLRLAWDPRISILDYSTTNMEVRISFFFHEIGSLVDKSFEGLIKL
jgi:hypothetical protein